MKSGFLSLLMMLVVAQIHAQGAGTGKEREQLSFQAFVEIFEKAGSSAQILDARSEEEYRQNHIKGAVFVDTQERFERVADGLDRERPVFVYSIGNGRSGRLAQQLEQKGFKEVYEVPGGLSKWIGEGKPVVSTVGDGLNLQDFERLIASDQWVLINFTSRYCGGCKKLEPVLESFENEVSGKVKVVRIEAYENKKLTTDLAIAGLPTLLLYKDGKVIWTKKGLVSHEELTAKVD